MKIKITGRGIFDGNGKEIPIGTEFDVKKEPTQWAGRYEKVGSSTKGKKLTSAEGDAGDTDGEDGTGTASVDPTSGGATGASSPGERQPSDGNPAEGGQGADATDGAAEGKSTRPAWQNPKGQGK